MTEKEKYISIYAGELSKFYNKNDFDGINDGGYGRRCWGCGCFDYIKNKNIKSICDVGCGYGVFCNYIVDFVDDVYGIDIASVDTGNVIKNKNIKYISSEAKSISLPDKVVEYVTSFDCLEHCLPEDIEDILKEFDRISTKGFIFSISYDYCSCAGVDLHMTVRSEDWWIERISKFGNVKKYGNVPITGIPYIICEKDE